MEKNKIETYLGFCIRARKIIFGTEMISRRTKGVKLLMFDGSMGASSLKIMINSQSQHGCPMLQTEAGYLGELVHRASVKAVAITDENLSKAILSVVQGQSQIKFYSGGNN